MLNWNWSQTRNYICCRRIRLRHLGKQRCFLIFDLEKQPRLSHGNSSKQQLSHQFSFCIVEGGVEAGWKGNEQKFQSKTCFSVCIFSELSICVFT